jgi:hypothetical protein
VLVGKFIRRKAQRNPELRLIEAPVLKRELKIARHHSNDRIRPAVESDEAAQHVRIAMISIPPERVADHRYRFMTIFFFMREHASQDWLHTQRGKNACRKPGRMNLFWSCLS